MPWHVGKSKLLNLTRYLNSIRQANGSVKSINLSRKHIAILGTFKMELLQTNSAKRRNVYRGHAFWLPFVRYPSRIFPVFLKSSKRGKNALIEVGDKSGNKVAGYFRFDPETLTQRFRPETRIENSWIGAPLRQYVAFSKKEIHEFSSVAQMKREIMGLVLEQKAEISSNDPFFGLELLDLPRMKIPKHSFR